jgi:hypothetical protein
MRPLSESVMVCDAGNFFTICVPMNPDEPVISTLSNKRHMAGGYLKFVMQLTKSMGISLKIPSIICHTHHIFMIAKKQF